MKLKKLPDPSESQVRYLRKVCRDNEMEIEMIPPNMREELRSNITSKREKRIIKELQSISKLKPI